ncbi:MAG TPA: hypothetical protein P5228_04200, partial [Bacteroidales bacterium]|nr:hypothetical protein [Bacteroidales bacterium]
MRQTVAYVSFFPLVVPASKLAGWGLPAVIPEGGGFHLKNPPPLTSFVACFFISENPASKLAGWGLPAVIPEGG